MLELTATQRSARFARAGIAPLEFVMALPVLLLLIVGITWLGFTMIAQTEVLIEARNKAWKRRFEDISKKPLYFPLLIGLYDEKKDYAHETATKKVNVSPLFNLARAPAAGHTILAGSWDHQAMSFKDPPDLKLMAVAAGIGLFGTGLDVAASLDDPLGLLQEAGNFLSSGKNTQTQTANSISNIGKGESTPGGGGTAPGGPSTPNSDQGKAQTEANRQKDKEKLEKRRDELGGRVVYRLVGGQLIEVVEPESGLIKAVADELDRLSEQAFTKVQAIRNETDEEKKKQLQKELDAIDRQIDLKKISLKRLEAEVLHVNSELKALG
jgi:hypothetical protein